MGRQTFEDLKAYSKKVIEAIPVEQVAVITFATTSKLAIPFTPKSEAIDQIDTKVKYRGGATYLGEALDVTLGILEDQLYVSQIWMLHDKRLCLNKCMPV